MGILKFSSALALLILFDNVSALYFHIAEGERKCFIEEIPDDTTVIGNSFNFDIIILLKQRTCNEMYNNH